MGIFSKKKTPEAASKQNPQAVKAPPSNQNNAINTAQPSNQATSSNIPSLPLPSLIDPAIDPVAYLKSLPSIRSRAKTVYEQRKSLRHFTYNEGNLKEVVRFVVSIIKRDYGTDYASIPPHGRWQHLDVGGRKRVDELIATFSNVDIKEKTRRVIDLFLVSVLLDAGAGNKWAYKASNGKLYRRSEGLAIAVLEMFQNGAFSSNPNVKTQVDAKGLANITADMMAKAMQVTPTNPLTGLEGRASLLTRLGHALTINTEIFGPDGRPGYMLDHLLSLPSTVSYPGGAITSITNLWTILLDGLSSIWPVGRTHLEGSSLGDAWPYQGAPREPQHAQILPFHKLTQWLAYSLMTPMTKLMNLRFAHAELLTGLPEYRNGGLFVDLGVLTLKKDDADRGLAAFTENSKIPGQQATEVVPMFDVSDDVVVEWRAMTVCLLDQVHAEVNRVLNLSGARSLSLPQILEAGTWKAGREIAEVQRPNTKGSPLAILSDGTVF